MRRSALNDLDALVTNSICFSIRPIRIKAFDSQRIHTGSARHVQG
jgi:hypothetical protein